MPINVTCPECESTFLVGDEFAGQPGRCPECGTVILVRDSDLEDDVPEIEPSPYDTPRALKDYENFPTRSTRSEPEYWRQDQPLSQDEPPEERKFDSGVRAKRWRSVQRALGYGQIAMLLGFLSLILQTILAVARGGGLPNQNDGLDSGQIAMIFGMLALMLAASLFWVLGRGWIMRSPYVPARFPARIGFMLSLLSMGGIVLTFCCTFMVAGQAANAQMNGGGPPGEAVFMVLMLMAFFALTCAVLLGSEIAFLVAVGRVCDGLKERQAGGWARRSIVVLVIAAMACFVGVMTALMMAGEAEQKRQAQAKQAAPLPKNANEGNEKKEKAKEVPKQGENANPAPAKPDQPPPEPAPMDHVSGLIFELSFIGSMLVYFLHVAIALQIGRRAIGREIRRLTGETDDRYGHPDEHY